MASRLTEIEAAMADGRTDLDQLRDGLVARGELMGEAIEATNAEIVRLEQEFLQILSSLEVQGMLTADAQHRVMDAEAALSDCQSRCPPGGGR